MKRALLTSILVLMILSSLFVSPAKAMPGTTWATGIKIQNLNPGTVAVFSISLYEASGVEAVTISQTADNKPLEAQPGKSVEVFLPSFGQVNPGQYSAVVSSSAEIGAVVTNTNYNFGIADSYNTMAPATTISVPYVYRNHNSWSTEIFIQNTSADQVANVDVVLREPSSSVAYTDPGVHEKTISLPIEPNGVISVDTTQAEHSDLQKFIGAATIVSTNNVPVTVVANQIRLVGASNTKGNVMISARGLTDADAGTRILLPSLYKDFTGASGTWKTGVKIQKLGDGDAHAVVTFVSDPNTPEFTGTASVTVPGNDNIELYLPSLKLDDGNALPAGFRGSAIITSDADVVATVQHTNYAGAKGYGVAMGYAGFAKGDAEISLPTLYNWPSGAGVWVSGVKIQNYGTNDVSVTVEFSPDPDSVSKVTGTKSGIPLGDGEAVELYFGSMTLDDGQKIPSGWKGSAKIVGTTTSGEAHLVATVINTNYGRNVANMYTGVAIP